MCFGLVIECLPLARVVHIAGEREAEWTGERQCFPIGLDKQNWIVGKRITLVADFEMEVRAGGAGEVGVAGEGNGLPAGDGLSACQVWTFEQVAVERDVAVGMTNCQVVRPGPVREGIDFIDHAIPDGDDGGAAMSGKIETEVQTLPGTVPNDTGAVGEDGVAVGLAEEPRYPIDKA